MELNAFSIIFKPFQTQRVEVCRRLGLLQLQHVSTRGHCVCHFNKQQLQHFTTECQSILCNKTHLKGEAFQSFARPFRRGSHLCAAETEFVIFSLKIIIWG